MAREWAPVGCTGVADVEVAPRLPQFLPAAYFCCIRRTAKGWSETRLWVKHSAMGQQLREHTERSHSCTALVAKQHLVEVGEAFSHKDVMLGSSVTTLSNPIDYLSYAQLYLTVV